MAVAPSRPCTSPNFRRFWGKSCLRVPIGRCQRCGRRLRARHPDQTSDALGAAPAQVGLRAMALAVQLNKTVGASMGKTAAIVGQVSGTKPTAGGLSQALARGAKQANPTYEALMEAVRESPVVAPDETGWRVGGRSQWLWAFVGRDVTVYRIQPGRGFGQAAAVLGAPPAVHRGRVPKLHGSSAPPLSGAAADGPRRRSAGAARRSGGCCWMA